MFVENHCSGGKSLYPKSENDVRIKAIAISYEPHRLVRGVVSFKYLESVFKSNLEGIRKYVDMDKNPEVEEEVVRMSGMGQTIHDNALLKGEIKGENRLAKLMSYLFSQGKIKEAELAATDETARKEMYKKYHIID